MFNISGTFLKDWFLVIRARTITKSIRCIVVLVIINLPLFSQVSLDNYIGDWDDPASWTPEWTSPQVSGITSTISINGYITRNGDLDFSSGGFIINDTLVIQGNLSMGSATNITINSNGILIVYGDLTMDGSASILTNSGSYLITSGTLSYNEGYSGSFVANGNPLLNFFDAVVPGEISDNDANYAALNCTSASFPYSSSGCAYGNMTDLSNDPIYSFYQSLLYDSPVISQQPQDISVCSNESVILSVVVSNVYSFAWQLDEGSGFHDLTNGSDYLGVDSDELTIVNASVLYSGYNYRCSVLGLNGSSVISDTSTISVFELPVADAGSGGDECDLDFSLYATASTGTGSWTTSSGTGTATFSPDAYDPSAVVTVSDYGTYSFTWTEVNGICSDADTITVNFYEPPVADAGSGGDECDLDFSLSATASTGTGSWTTSSGTGTATFSPDAYDPAAVVTVGDYGTYSFTWTEVNGSCSDADTITVTFYEPPVADAGSGGDECDLDFSLYATASTGTGCWTTISGTGTATFSPDADDPAAVVTVSDYGTYSFTWTEVNGICSDADTITVNFYEPPVADAGSGGDECDLDFSLYATASTGTGSWTKSSGTGTATFSPGAGDPLAVVTVSDYGTYSFAWTEVNGSCSDVDTITVTFYEPPVADADSGGDECDLDFSLYATASTGTGTWTNISGTGTATFSPGAGDPAAVVTVSDYGTYSFTWTEVNGPCSDADTITVTFYEPPVADAGSGGDECDLDYSLYATASTGTGTWTTSSGTGTATFSPDAYDPAAVVTVSDYGTYSFTWTEVNGICSDADTITVSFYEPPVADAGSGGDECDLDYSLYATASTGTGSWTKSSGTGTATFSPDADDPAAVVTVSDYGTYSFTWTEVNGTCSDADTIPVNFYEPPVADAGSGGDECDLDFSLYATASTGTGTWTTISGTGTATFSPDAGDPAAVVTVSDYGTYSFTWTEVNGPCSDADTITVSFNLPPVVNAGEDQKLNGEHETYMQAVLNAGETGEWSLISGYGNLEDMYSPVSRVTDLDDGITVFKWLVSNISCNDSDEVSIFVSDRIIPNVITPNGDGKNDFFVIPGIEENGPVKLVIVDRWGKEVYRDNNYQNNWSGYDNKGNELKNDTYYYFVEFADRETVKNYVLIKR